ncbi:MAG: membrane dipeptidase [Verrucomicrobiales bacterium]|nr:membrane dipeptidase [Verrucomicrobiales bacterium]
MKLIFDVHLDLSMNALEWNRDLTLSLAEIRALEKDMTDMKGRGENTVTFEEMRRGGIGLCVATQIGGCMKPAGPCASWESPSQAWAMTQGQRIYYETMAEMGEMSPVRNLAELDAHLAKWADPMAAREAKEPIGYILSLEGADSIITPDYLETAYESGLRALGPAHYGKGRYALGHDQVGGLREAGPDLLRKMDELGIILDATHLSDDCFFEALEMFGGTVWASHSNCRALVDDPRQFSDEQIKILIERDAVIGSVFDGWMMIPGWERGVSTPQSTGVKIEHIVDHIDHICQLAGNAKHVGIGSDLDGGFGREQGPMDLDSIADLQTLDDLLTARGYSNDDIAGIFSGNFLNLLRRAWS